MAATPTEYKLVVVGGGGVGKSALTIQFIQVSVLTLPRVDVSSKDAWSTPSYRCILDASPHNGCVFEGCCVY